MRRSTKKSTARIAAPDRREDVFAEQVRFLFVQGRVGAIGTLIVVVFLPALLWYAGNREHVVSWFVVAFTIAAIRLGYVILYHQLKPPVAEARRWANRFIVVTLLSGICWGVAAAVLLPLQQPMAQMFITFVLGGVMAGAIPYLSPVLRAYAAYSLPALLPLVATFLYLDGPIYTAMSLGTSLYIFLMFAATLRSNKTLRKSFELRFENRHLVEHLERTNAELTAEVTERRRVETALGLQKERALVTLESIGDGVITTDMHSVIEYLNPIAEQLTGWSLNEARGHKLLEAFQIVNEDNEKPLEDPVARCLRQQGSGDVSDKAVLVHRHERRFAIEHSVAPIRDRSGETIGAVVAFRDVTQQRLLAQQISYQARHDPLTGLINRREFESRLQHAFGTSQAEGREHALCYFDLDQFKIVNDTRGHAAGDELLRQLAAYLQTKIRNNDCMARLGGDEFGVLLEGCSLEKARDIADTLRGAIRDFRFVWDGHSHDIGASFGLVPVNTASGSLAELLSAADSACYVAKDQGRNRVHVYEPDDKILAQRNREMQWVSRLTKALEQNRLHLYFQPMQWLSAPDSTDDVCEVLLRMWDEDGRLASPSAFLPAAERYGFMPRVDRWVTRTTFDALVAGKSGCDHYVVSINLSGQSLGDSTFLEFVTEEFERTRIDPRRICFEITETAAIANLTGATRFISTLRAMGCQFALDDFGSGLSSFGYLKDLKVDYLKIAGHFVHSMVTDPIDDAMVKSINQIGHVMGLLTVAENVENKETLLRLREIGVDLAQGYFIARPIPFRLTASSAKRAVL